MIWSEKELANMSIAGANVVKDRVLPYLGDSENSDIFLAKNFSLLWGILGIAGAEGVSEEAAIKIWQALKDNGAVDAYDKGFLADFTKAMAKKHQDERLRAWLKCGNYEFSQIFKKEILSKLLKSNNALEAEILPYCVNGEKLITTLETTPLSKRLKAYLESLRGIEYKETLNGTDIAAVYDKERVLKKLSDVIVYSRREFNEEEKDYLFFYIKEALKSGFRAENIGFDDRVLAKFVANTELVHLAELDSQPIILRHQEMMSLAVEYDEKQGFFEQTGAQLIHFNPKEIDFIFARCEKLIGLQASPKGVVFALELLNLGKVKSAVKILAALAEKGQATQMACFMHRLLPQAVGAESFLASILATNFHRLHAMSVLGKQDDYNEYVARLYMQAVRSFIDAEHCKEAVNLLKMLADQGCFDNVSVLKTEFMSIANAILHKDKDLSEPLSKIIYRLKLQLYEDGGEAFVFEEKANPITAARQKLQETIKDTTTFDVSMVLDKMAAAEDVTFGAYQNIKKALTKGFFKKENNESVEEKRDEFKEKITEEAPRVAEKKATENNIAENDVETAVKAEEEIVAEPEVKAEETVVTEPNAPGEIEEVNQTAIESAPEILTEPEVKAEETVVTEPNAPGEIEEENQTEIESAPEILTEPEVKAEETVVTEPNAETVTEEVVEVISEPETIAEPKVEMAREDELVNEEALLNRDEYVPEEISEENDEQEIPTEENSQSGLNIFENYNNILDENINVLDDVSKSSEIHGPLDGFDALYYEDDNDSSVQTDVLPEAIVTQHEVSEKKQETPLLQTGIQEWIDETPEQAVETEPEIVSETEQNTASETEPENSKKINVNNILNITSKEMDKHYERIKLVTSSTFKKAEQQVAEIKKRVSDTNITASPSVSKIRQLAQKIKFFKKKP